MADRIQQRRDTAERWAQFNPILLEGEVGYVLDNANQYKIGDGINAWNDLPLRGYSGTVNDSIGISEDSVMTQESVTSGLAKYATFLDIEKISSKSLILMKSIKNIRLYGYDDGEEYKIYSLSYHNNTRPTGLAITIANVTLEEGSTTGFDTFIVSEYDVNDEIITLSNSAGTKKVLIEFYAKNIIDNGNSISLPFITKEEGKLKDFVFNNKIERDIFMLKPFSKFPNGFINVRPENPNNIVFFEGFNEEGNYEFSWSTQLLVKVDNQFYRFLPANKIEFLPSFSKLAFAYIEIDYKNRTISDILVSDWKSLSNENAKSWLNPNDYTCRYVLVMRGYTNVIEWDNLGYSEYKTSKLISELQENPGVYSTFGQVDSGTNSTNNYTVCFIDNKSAYVNKSNGKLYNVSLKVNATGTFALIHMRKTSEGRWDEVNRYMLNANLIGINNIDVSSLNIEVITNDTFGFAYPNSSGENAPNLSYTPNSEGYDFISSRIDSLTGKFYFDSNTFPNYSESQIGTKLDLKLTFFTPIIDSLNSLSDKVDKNSNDISELQENLVNISSNSKRGVELYRTNFLNLSENWEVNGWSLSEIDSGIKSNGTGFNNSIVLSNFYSLDRRSARTTVVFSSDSRFMLYTKNGGGNVNLQTISEVDVSSGKMRIYKAFNGTDLPDVSTEGDISIIPGKEYVIELSINKNEISHKLTVTDVLSGEQQHIEDKTRNAGRQHDLYAMCNYSGGSVIVKNFSVATPVKKGCYCVAMGDSISEALGNGVTTCDGYAQRLISAVGGDGAVSGRGGGNITDLLKRIETEIKFIKPTWLSIMIGTNGGNSLINLRTLINRAKELGCEVILNNIPMKGTSTIEWVEQQNEIIKTIRNEFNLSGALMDVSTSIDNTPSMGQDESKFYPDKVHPILFGQTFMFQRFYLDAPEILY